jgi:hypothetical protein
VDIGLLEGERMRKNAKECDVVNLVPFGVIKYVFFFKGKSSIHGGFSLAMFDC